MEGEAFASAGEVVSEVFTDSHTTTETSATSKITQESVQIKDGVKTVVRKTIVDGLVVASTTEKIQLQEPVEQIPTKVEEVPTEEEEHEEEIYLEYDDEVVGVLSDEPPVEHDPIFDDVDDHDRRGEL